MANVLIEESTMTSIAESIRSKTGKSALILPADMPGQIDGIPTGGSGGLTMKSGTTDSATIETGLSSIQFLFIYKTSVRETGFVQGAYIADAGRTYYVYCSSYSTYMKTMVNSSNSSSTIDGGTFTWGGSSTSALSSGKTYNWIAFGEE